jgi:ABC-type multidrug transport system fused ATPase/permease subunit
MNIYIYLCSLFTGTVRYNLDLRGAHKQDDEIWKVLDMVEMRQAIAELPLGLDTQVAEGIFFFFFYILC